MSTGISAVQGQVRGLRRGGALNGVADDVVVARQPIVGMPQDDGERILGESWVSGSLTRRTGRRRTCATACTRPKEKVTGTSTNPGQP